MVKIISRAEMLTLKKILPTGTEVICDNLNNKLQPIVSGTHGIVRHIDDTGIIYVTLATGNTIGITYGIDSCHVAATNE